MIVASDLLGEVVVEEDELITFPTGLLGFPATRTFILIPSEREGMYWLQSAEHSPLAFVLVDPFLAFPGFAVDVSPADLSDLDAVTAADVAILAIVTLGSECTMNLQGPLAFNLGKKRGKQLAVANSEYGVRYPVDLRALAS